MLCTYRAPVQGDNERTTQDVEPSRQGMIRGANGVEG
jgi:hypothetical protein